MAHLANFQTNRPHGIGGSDIAAVLGLSPFKTPLELWAEKVGHPGVQEPSGIHLRYGQHLEPFVASEYERVTGLHTSEVSSSIFHPEHGFMFASIDRLVTDCAEQPATQNGHVVAQRILECKTASVFSRADWGTEGTDQVPTAYLLQCAWYMAIADCQQADLAVLLGNNDFRVYTIQRDMRLEGLILAEAQRFWFDHVLACEPPAPRSAQDALLLFPKDQDGLRLEADEDTLQLIERYESASEDASEIGAEVEDIRAQLMARMGSAQEITSGSKVLATWRCSRPTKRIDVTALRSAHPDIAEQFSVTSAGSRRFVVRGLA
jgi:putative phage-type endonuclease